MAESQIEPPCKLHRFFRLYDPEVVAILTILLGLFQVLMAFPTYYMSINIHVLYMCPVFVGTVFVAGGSFAMACERSPSRKQVKYCVYTSGFGLLVGLSAIVVYGYAINDIKSVELCGVEVSSMMPLNCPEKEIVDFFNSVSTLLLIYDIGSLTLLCPILFSAMKGLKTN